MYKRNTCVCVCTCICVNHADKVSTYFSYLEPYNYVWNIAMMKWNNFVFILEKSKWATWSSWGECSATCGVGNQIRKRICKNPSSGEGCVGERLQIQACLEIACPRNGKSKHSFSLIWISEANGRTSMF